jgi:hypothetical protein
LSPVVIDDHLLRDVLVGERPFDLGIEADGLATTGLWLFRLCSSFAHPTVVGKLSAPVAALSEQLQAEFRSQLMALPAGVDVVHMRDLAWLMAELQSRHRAERRLLSAAMVEALAAAHWLGGAIAVSANDVGPHLQAAARADRIPFHLM